MDTPDTTLITGINGFVGKWLADCLQEVNVTVHGVDLQNGTDIPGVQYRKINITDSAKLVDLIAGLKPASLFHLAGISYLPEADSSPRRVIDTNISGTLALLDAVRNGSPGTKLLLVGSSKEYGHAADHENVTEETVPRPDSFYGISKYTGELAGREYHRQFGIDVRCSRSFNHTGPGQPPRFVCSDWARQTANIALGRSEPLVKVGNLDELIDFCDVRDVVKAYRAIIDKGYPGEVYNVCSGRGTPLSRVLDYLTNKCPGPVTVEQATDRKLKYRPTGKLTGSYGRLQAHTGWAPSIPLEKTLDDLYDYWLTLLKNDAH